MRSYQEYRKILKLWEQGLNREQIAQLTSFPNKIVVYCIEKYGSLAELETSFGKRRILDINTHVVRWSAEQRKWYAYLLAVYLGDGWISKTRNTFRLRVACDSKYPGIIQRISEAIPYFCPDNSINVVKKKNSRGVELTCYSNLWVSLLPQHGAGRKHNRKIALESWQQDIAQEHPMEFLRGFIHTDVAVSSL